MTVPGADRFCEEPCLFRNRERLPIAASVQTLVGSLSYVDKNSLDLGCDFREDLVEHDPGHEERQDQVECLAANIENNRLAAL